MSIPPRGGSSVSRRRAMVAIASCAFVVAVLAIAVVTGFGPLLRADHAVATAVYVGDDRPRWLARTLQVVTAPGLSVVRDVVFTPVVVWLVLRRAWWTTAWVAVAVLGIAPLTTGIKDAVGRARPDFAEGGARYTSQSFPSGHSSGIATAVVVGLVLAWPLLGPILRRWCLAAGAVVAVVVGCSRMWLGVHYLSDVVAGWALGVAWTFALALAFDVLPGGRAAVRRGKPVASEQVA